jgi:hypothetical protein
MDAQNKPTFSTWDRSNLDKITSELWDNNIQLREANEQLRNDLKDAMRLLREARNKDDWK